MTHRENPPLGTAQGSIEHPLARAVGQMNSISFVRIYLHGVNPGGGVDWRFVPTTGFKDQMIAFPLGVDARTGVPATEHRDGRKDVSSWEPNVVPVAESSFSLI